MDQSTAASSVQYVGFWARFGAAIIDSIILVVAVTPLVALLGLSPEVKTNEAGFPILGPEYWSSVSVNQFIAAGIVLAFWLWKMATPGKMVIGAVIVDAQTLGKPSAGTFVLRYLGYFVSTIPLGLGLLWVGWDPRKQGWHDKIAGTVVVKKSSLPAVAPGALPQ